MSPNPDSQREPSREELIALIAAQAAEIAALKARIAELERRLGLNSSNSGKPPSSDGLKKPPRPARTQSLRGPSNKPSGGQKGHKGETLEQVAAPDHVIDHVPPSCATCGSAMTLEMTVGHSARQVFDLPARLDRAPHLLSHLPQAWQPAGQRRRHCRARPLEALLHPARRAACAMQCPSPTRTQGADRDREGGLGAPDAAIAAPRLPRRQSRARAGWCSRHPQAAPRRT